MKKVHIFMLALLLIFQTIVNPISVFATEVSDDIVADEQQSFEMPEQELDANEINDEEAPEEQTPQEQTPQEQTPQKQTPQEDVTPTEETDEQEVVGEEDIQDESGDEEELPQATQEKEKVDSADKKEKEVAESEQQVEETVDSDQVIESLAIDEEEDEEDPQVEKSGFHFSLSKFLNYNQDEVNEENPLNMTSQFYVEYKWGFDNDHGYIAGDSVTFKLPSQLKIEKEMSGRIDFEGERMAGYVIGTDGTITLTFTQLITDLSEVRGTVWVLSELEQSEVTIEDGEIEIGPMEDGTSIKVPVITQNQKAAISKKGVPIPSFSPNEIKWTIEVDTMQTKHKNGVVTDTLPEGLTYKDGSLTIDGVAAANPQVNGQELTINVGDFKGKKTIELIATIDNLEAPTFVNEASFVSEGSDKVDTVASVDIRRGESLEKFAGRYDAKKRTIEWTVNLNFDNKNVPADELIDSWQQGIMELVDGSLKLVAVTLDNDGKPTPGDEVKVKITDSTDSGFKVSLPALTGPYQLTYTTKLKERAINGSNVENTVEWNGKEKSVVKYVSSNLGKKNYHSVDYKNKTVTWRIDYNSDEQEMTDTIITDKIQQGMELIGDVIVWSEEDIAPVISYEDSKFTVSIPGKINKSFYVEYTTSFDYRALDGLDQKKFTNTAHIKWNEHQNGDEVTKDFWPNGETQNDGSKSGWYNSETKEITWTVIVNYQQNEYESLIVNDILVGNQKLLFDSIIVSEVELNQWGGIVKEIPIEGSATKNDDGFTVDLGPTNKTHKIVYKTTLEGLSKIEAKYHNTAIVTSGDKEITKLPASVDIINGGNYVDKSGAQNGDLIDWSLVVNATQATLKNVVLTDTLNNDQEFVESSVKIYTTKQGTTEKAAELSADKYTVAISGEDEETLTIKFNEEINRAYIVEYSTIYFAGHQETVENKVRITGNGVNGEESKEDNVLVTIVQQSGGTGVGEVGYLMVKKLGDNGKALAGVTFKLFDQKGQELREGTSDEEGMIDFKRLRYGTYSLEEVETAEGYILLDEPVEVKIDQKYDAAKPDSIQTIEITNEKEVKAIKIVKVDKETTERLDGAEFEIQDVDGEVVVEKITTADGEVVVDLKEGNYKLVETKAPKGYKQLLEPIEFTIEAGKTAALEIVVENEKVELCEQFEIRAEDEAGKNITSVVVTDKDGEKVKESDTNSIILDRETTEEGTYTVEVTTEDGRTVLEEIEVTFEEDCKEAVVLIVPAPDLCEQFEIRAEDEAGKNITSIVVTDKDGEKVKESDTDSIVLDRETTEEGTYTVVATTEDGRTVSEEIEVIFEEDCKEAIVLTVPAPELCEQFEIRAEDEAGKKITSIVVTGKDGEKVKESDTDSIILDRETTEEGTYTVVATTEDGRTVSEEIEVVFEEDCKEAIILTVPAPELCEQFEIRAEDEAGKKITSIELKDSEGNVVKESDTDAIILDRETTEEGTYTVVATTEDGRTVSQEIEVVFEEECKEAIVLTVPAPPAPEVCEEFEIHAKDEAGKKITSIEVKDSEGNVVKESDTDAIILDRETTEEGTYTVVATTEDGRTVSQEIEVVFEEECKEAIVLTVPAPPAPEVCEEVTIEIKDHNGKPVKGKEFTFESKDGKKYTVTTDKDGKITLDRDSMPVGVYTVKDSAGKTIGTVEIKYGEECEAYIIDLQAPETSEIPKAPGKPSTVSGKQINQLPNTATNMYTTAFVGAGVFLFGLLLLMFIRRKKDVTK